MLARRDFIKITGAATGSFLLDPSFSSGKTQKTAGQYFAIHPFIEQNPDAVFIMRTNVDVKTNDSAKREAGKLFGQNIFSNQLFSVFIGHKYGILLNQTPSGTSIHTF